MTPSGSQTSCGSKCCTFEGMGLVSSGCPEAGVIQVAAPSTDRAKKPRETPSRKSAHAARTVCPKTQAVASVPERKFDPGKCGLPGDPSEVMPVATVIGGVKVSPPSLETTI